MISSIFIYLFINFLRVILFKLFSEGLEGGVCVFFTTLNHAQIRTHKYARTMNKIILMLNNIFNVN